jgi:hypothetical protein
MYLKDYKDPKVVIPFREIVNGIGETSDYAKSIAVIAFNRYLERPSNVSKPASP